MNLELLKKPLPIENIDFRIQSINKGWYATILAYKDARVDMQRLDEAAWPLNWKRGHTRDNKNYIVSIYDESKKEWVSKEDTWTESMSEAEKWLASDSFKRACFNWWIWRELYDYPIIQVKLEQNDKKDMYWEWYIQWDKVKQWFWLKLKEWTWKSYFENWELKALACKDQNNKLRFSYWDINLLKK